MKRNLHSEFFRYTSHSVLGMLGLSCYILADTFFVSKGLGSDGLAALNLAIPVYSLIYGCGLMIGVGGATQYTFSRSRGEEAQGNRAFIHALCLGTVLSFVFMLLGLFCADEIARLLGADAVTFAMSHTYLRMLLLCSPAFLANGILSSFIRNDGSPRLAMAGMLAGSFSNILLDWVFIFPCRMGIFGAVLATCMAPVISMGVLSVHFLRRRNRFHISGIRLDVHLTAAMLGAGGPSLIGELSSGAVIVVFNRLMLEHAGNTGVAAYGIIANLCLVVISVYNGIGQGMQPLLSMYYGMQKTMQVRRILRLAVITAAALSCLLYGGIFLGAPGIAAVFNSEGDAQLQEMAVYGLRLYFLGALPAGVNILLSVFCSSTERPKPGNVLSVLRGFVLILPLAFLMTGLWELTGLWLTFPLTEVLTVLAGCLILFRRGGSAGRIKSV